MMPHQLVLDSLPELQNVQLNFLLDLCREGLVMEVAWDTSMEKALCILAALLTASLPPPYQKGIILTLSHTTCRLGCSPIINQSGVSKKAFLIL